MITPCIHPESLRTMAKLEDSGRSHRNSVILPFPFSSFEIITTGLRRFPLLGHSSKKKKYTRHHQGTKNGCHDSFSSLNVHIHAFKWVQANLPPLNLVVGKSAS